MEIQTEILKNCTRSRIKGMLRRKGIELDIIKYIHNNNIDIYEFITEKEKSKKISNYKINIFINNAQKQLDKDNKDLNDAKEFLRYLDDPYMYDMENVIFDNFNMIKKFEYIMCKNGLDFLLVVEDGEFECFNQYKFKTIKEQRKADELFEKYCI
jgi:hypothetical protein